MSDNHIQIAHAMVAYGGSFIAKIGEALLHADKTNISKIRSAWPNEWEEFGRIAEIKNRQIREARPE